MSEFDGVETFIMLDWFVKDYLQKTRKYSLSGDKGTIMAANLAAKDGLRLLAVVKGRIRPVLKMGFELRQEAVPTSVEGTWFNLPFLSFGTHSENLEKTQAVGFILGKIKQMELPSPKLSFKLFYLPSLPSAISTEGVHMSTLGGFTNINKERIELNVFPPRKYDTIFKNLVHEIIHMCFLQESKKEEAAEVEAKVEAYTTQFFNDFSNDLKSVEKPMLEELCGAIDNVLIVFSKADDYLLKIMNLDRSKAAIQTMSLLFNAVLSGNVTVKPKS